MSAAVPPRTTEGYKQQLSQQLINNSDSKNLFLYSYVVTSLHLNYKSRSRMNLNIFPFFFLFLSSLSLLQISGHKTNLKNDNKSKKTSF